jgi:hypothetical protein
MIWGLLENMLKNDIIIDFYQNCESKSKKRVLLYKINNI